MITVASQAVTGAASSPRILALDIFRGMTMPS